MSDERGDLNPQEMDELASAYLDGEATPEEVALVESDPRMQALVEELRAVRDLVAAPVEMPSDEVRDQMIARALDHRAPVVSLETARRRLRAIPPQARVILAAAAVIAAIAVVGVTVFEQQGDEFAGNDDSASAPAMADAPADAEPEAPAPVAAAEAESLEVPEESAPMDDSDDSGEAFAAETPAEQAGDEEMAIELSEAPMDDGYAADASAEDSGEPEPMMSDEPEAAPTSGDALLVFETAADLADYALLLTEELIYVRETERLDDATEVDLLGCPLFPDEGLELLARFDALVDEVDVQVSVYLADIDLQLIETTPPPECAPHNESVFLGSLE
ncbi:anti-sigma factor family protein [Candidatus Poriferisocius sp.]|uniref:anti-sigma factor family protein n=1 Tax=Candidatus Poriferisocius sp. TaxID=3101276 RepID=UPI003B027402